jgi:hypothetical protein
VYAAQVDDYTLSFEVFGVWRKNMLLRDRETGTIWQQATGEAIDGPLRGCQLEALASQETTWGELASSVPGAVYALAPAHSTGLIPDRWLRRLLPLAGHIHLHGLAGFDRRLDGHAIVIGVVVAGEAKAYPMAALQAKPVIHDRIGSQDITLTYQPAGSRVTVQGQEGQVLRHERLWWLAWSEFHPRSSLYDLKDI